MNSAVSPKHVKGEVFREILPGSKMKLEFTGGDLPRLAATLVGYEVGKYVVVRLQDTHCWSRYAEYLLPNSKLIARLIIEGRFGECLAFRTMVRWQSHHPLDFLFLSFPDTIQKVDLRAHIRLPTAFTGIMADTVNLLKTGRKIMGHVRDVSLGGCCFEFDLPRDRIGVSPRPIQIQIGKNILLKGDVRNQRTSQKDRIAIGMQFVTSEKETKKLLSALYVAPELLTAC